MITARWENGGKSFVIVGPEESAPQYEGVEFADYVPKPPYPAPAKPEWTMLYIGRGKRDKLSKGDIVGFLCKTGDLKASDIGMIDVRERYAHVAVRSSMVKQALHNITGEKIKKMSTKIEAINARRSSK